MKQEIKYIGKEEAQELLKANTNNRRHSIDHVTFLAGQMKEGKWKFTADPIKISKSGRLLDGQHRLMAIVRSETIQKVLVVSDLEDEIFDVLDTGKNRNASDILSIKRIPSYTIFSALAKMLMLKNTNSAFWTLESGINGRKRSTTSNAAVLGFVELNYASMKDSIDFAHRLYKKANILTKAEYAFFHYLFKEKDRDMADYFLSRISTGESLQAGCPILFVRNKLIESATSTLRLPQRIKFHYILKAWNYYRQGANIKFIRVNNDEVLPDVL